MPDRGLAVPTPVPSGDGAASLSGNVIPRRIAAIPKTLDLPADAIAIREACLHNPCMLHVIRSAVNPMAIRLMTRGLETPSGPSRGPLQPQEEAELRGRIAIERCLRLERSRGCGSWRDLAT